MPIGRKDRICRIEQMMGDNSMQRQAALNRGKCQRFSSPDERGANICLATRSRNARLRSARFLAFRFWMLLRSEPLLRCRKFRRSGKKSGVDFCRRSGSRRRPPRSLISDGSISSGICPHRQSGLFGFKKSWGPDTQPSTFPKATPATAFNWCPSGNGSVSMAEMPFPDGRQLYEYNLQVYANLSSWKRVLQQSA